MLTSAQIGRFLLHRVTRYVLAWLLALVSAGVCLYTSWIIFNTPGRRDGNDGHTTIDFGGQWLMGRLLVEGNARHLYHRDYQRRVFRAAYPIAHENPKAEAHDADSLMAWVMGEDNPDTARAVASLGMPLAVQDPLGMVPIAAACVTTWTPERLQQAATPSVGGPLYPPFHAFLMAPVALLPPQPGYRVMQVVSVALAFVAAWGIRVLSQGRIWWPLAVTALIAYPGFSGSTNLGQNAALTLTFLIWGWVFIARGQPAVGGCVWGLLAYKPVWATAFFLAAVLMRRWRVCLFMAGTALLLILATLPIVGWRSWLEWFQVGQMATRTYRTDQNWILLSRDLLGIPRRWLLEFQTGTAPHDRLAAAVAGWVLLVAVFEVTVRFACLRRDEVQQPTGPAPAFLLLGAWLTCFHFMYYDVLLTALPVLLLFMEPRRWFEPRLVAVQPLPRTALPADLAAYYDPWPAGSLPGPAEVQLGPRQLWVLNSLVMTLLAWMAIVEYLFPVLSVDVEMTAGFLRDLGAAVPQPLRFSTNLKGTPWHTFTLLVLWLWCGVLWLWQPRPVAAPKPVATAHPVFPAPFRAEAHPAAR